MTTNVYVTGTGSAYSLYKVDIYSDYVVLEQHQWVQSAIHVTFNKNQFSNSNSQSFHDKVHMMVKRISKIQNAHMYSYLYCKVCSNAVVSADSIN